MILLVDAESQSPVDLKKRGQDIYCNHPDTRAILWSVRAIEWADSLVFEEPDLHAILDKLKAANRIKWTRNEPLTLVHWGAFDRKLHGGVRQSEDGWVDERGCFWVDAREYSLTHGGPGSLEAAARFWAAGADLKHTGSHLIRAFCIPPYTKPEDDPVRWAEFVAYARQDTNVMVPIVQTMLEVGGHTLEQHWEHSAAVWRMNDRGVTIDRESAKLAVQLIEDLQELVKKEIEDEYGFSPTQVKKLADWLGTDDTTKETLDALYASTQDPAVREVIQARRVVSGAALKKLTPMLMLSSDEDPRVRGCFDYHGAHTRRLTSFGVQFQNMLRHSSSWEFFDHLPYVEAPDVELVEQVRENIRGFVTAAPEHELVAADYSQIELRYGAWVAGEEWMLEAFRENDKAVRAHGKKSPQAWATDLYVLSAADLIACAPAKVTDDGRQFGKTVELASIFGISAVGKHGDGGLRAYAAGMGIEMSEPDAWHAYTVYRRTHPKIVDAWDQFERAVQHVVRDRDTVVDVLGHRVEGNRAHVRVVRPSGFASYLWMPTLQPALTDDGEQRRDPETGELKWEIHYLARGRGGSMVRAKTWGSNIFQTQVQGGAADLMLEGLIEAELEGYLPVMSIHDEIVTEVPEGFGSVEGLCEILCRGADWAPGLPLTAEGWRGRRFTK